MNVNTLKVGGIKSKTKSVKWSTSDAFHQEDLSLPVFGDESQ